MKQERKVALGIAGIVVLAGIAGVAVFIATGSRVGVGFVLVGIPAILITAGILHVKGVVSRTGTTASEYKKQRLRSVGDRVRDCIETYDRLQESQPSFESNQLDNDLTQLLTRLSEQGITVDRESATYTVSSLADADVGELDRIESDADAFDTAVGEAFNEHVRDEVERLDGELRRLVSADLVSDYETLPLPASDVTGAGSLAANLEDARNTVESVVERATAELESVVSDASDQAAVERHLDDARNDSTRGDYETAVDQLLDARRTLSSDLSGDFEGKRAVLAALFEAVSDSPVDRHVDRTQLDAVGELKSEFQAADDALDIATLRRLETDLREVCADIVSTMVSDLAENVRTLETADIPDSFYSRPDSADQDYVAALDDTASVDAFRRTWLTAVEELIASLSETNGQVTAVDAYPDIESAIDSAFADGGVVTGNDLPVKRVEPFMALYAASHPGVTFDRDAAQLVQTEPEETHTVTVVASFEEPGEQREATVTIQGPRHSASTTITTYLADEVVFDDVPGGNYTVEADPGVDGYRTATADISVDESQEVSVTMSEVGLREQVCAGNEDAIRTALPDVEEELTSRFSADGHLSSRDTYPVKEGHVPCLLALWAEDEDHDVVLDADGDVLVYDGDELDVELSALIRHNIEPGEELSFDAVRQEFLSAPVPDGVIRDVVDALDVERPVETTDTSIIMEDTE